MIVWIVFIGVFGDDEEGDLLGLGEMLRRFPEIIL